jgi:hypothetical protein
VDFRAAVLKVRIHLPPAASPAIECGSRTQCLEAADDPALADHTPGTLWLGETGERLGTEILDLE